MDARSTQLLLVFAIAFVLYLVLREVKQGISAATTAASDALSAAQSWVQSVAESFMTNQSLAEARDNYNRAIINLLRMLRTKDISRAYYYAAQKDLQNAFIREAIKRGWDNEPGYPFSGKVPKP